MAHGKHHGGHKSHHGHHGMGMAFLALFPGYRLLLLGFVLIVMCGG